MPYVTVDGTRLHYREAGSGDPPLLLLHAFPLHSGMWQPQLAGLSDRVRLVAPDLKGFGASDAPDDRDAYSIAGYADDVAGLIDELGLAEVAVAGLSMGGYVAFALWRRHRARVSALVLADTRAEPDGPEAVERRTNQQRQVAEEGTAGLIDQLLDGLLSEATHHERPELVEQARQLMDNPSAGYIGALEAMKGRPDSTADLDGIDVPTLVLVGRDDPLTSPEVAQDLHARIAGSRLAVLPGAAHLSNLEAAEAFNAALRRFLDDL